MASRRTPIGRWSYQQLFAKPPFPIRHLPITWHHLWLHPRLTNTCITKIGLIDLDNLTKDILGYTRGKWHHSLHHQRKESLVSSTALPLDLSDRINKRGVTTSVKHRWISNPQCPRYWVQDNFTAPSCSDMCLGYLWSVMCITAYWQQGNCLSAQPLGVLSLVWFKPIFFTTYLMPLYDPYVTPLLHMLLSFIRTILLGLCVSIMLCWLCNLSIVLGHEFSHQQQCPCSFIGLFTHSLDLFLLLS